MKKLFLVIGGVAAAFLLFLVYARVFGFNPGPTAPGLWLTGDVATEPVTDWSFAAKMPGGSAVETKQWFAPFLAHSVTTGRFHVKDRLYFASGYPAGIPLPQGRHWNRNVLENPDVRLRIAGKLYDRRLVYVSDPVEREEVLRALGTMFWSPGFFLHLWRVEPRG